MDGIGGNKFLPISSERRNMEHKQYNKQQYNRKKQWYRFVLGIQQLLNYPVLNLIWILFGKCVIYFERYMKDFIAGRDVYYKFESVFSACVKVITIIFPIMCAIGIIQLIGLCFAIGNEAKLKGSFGKEETQLPILIYKKKDWKTKVVKREFYTTIPLECWHENQGTICFNLNCHIIGDITYGGKNKNTGNYIYFEAAKGMKPEAKGTLYDDTF